MYLLYLKLKLFLLLQIVMLINYKKLNKNETCITF